MIEFIVSEKNVKKVKLFMFALPPLMLTYFLWKFFEKEGAANPHVTIICFAAMVIFGLWGAFLAFLTVWFKMDQKNAVKPTVSIFRFDSKDNKEWLQQDGSFGLKENATSFSDRNIVQKKMEELESSDVANEYDYCVKLNEKWYHHFIG